MNVVFTSISPHLILDSYSWITAQYDIIYQVTTLRCTVDQRRRTRSPPATGSTPTTPSTSG